MRTKQDHVETALVEGSKYIRIAIIPPIILGLGITMATIIQGGPCDSVSLLRVRIAQGFGALISIIIFSGGVVGIFRRLPVWSYTWVGATLIGFLGLINIVDSEPDISIPRAMEVGIVILFLITVFVIYISIIFKGWEFSGLLSIMLSLTLSNILLFMAANTAGPYILNFLTLPVGILTAFLIFKYIKASRKMRVILFIIIAILNALLVAIVDQTFQSVKTTRESELLYLLVLITGILLIGPVLSLLLNPVLRLIKPKLLMMKKR